MTTFNVDSFNRKYEDLMKAKAAAYHEADKTDDIGYSESKFIKADRAFSSKARDLHRSTSDALKASGVDMNSYHSTLKDSAVKFHAGESRRSNRYTGTGFYAGMAGGAVRGHMVSKGAVSLRRTSNMLGKAVKYGILGGIAGNIAAHVGSTGRHAAIINNIHAQHHHAVNKVIGEDRELRHKVHTMLSSPDHRLHY